ncbi:type II toxin-antitoxin system RelE/ParE family toxin [Marinospirillum alkaliphilum]|uniref:Addiction module toxin, RelE/StbE family n=1 Tax=Marinospirillum alkaliphilum DSM 21637 TaxID=1122209 RepID=A0A1K1XN17_9GAMM|nr:type II toxin-antitoxin system RelE/ParE family toxin [Marinospirillum alkaliphilum]SFX51113.1 addiction module toxin, RelE/StbE family [Marinospirillum alkaliphilum DSM 21637]
MPRLIWTPTALKTLKEARDFMHQKSPEVAIMVIRTIRSHIKTLESHPKVGRPVTELAGDFREYVVPFGSSGYVVLYRLHQETVLLLSIRHQRQAGYSLQQR